MTAHIGKRGHWEEYMNSRKITALLLSSAMALSVLTGCGGVNKDKTVATLNGEPVKLGVANFAARFGQAGADDFYTAYFEKMSGHPIYMEMERPGRIILKTA